MYYVYMLRCEDGSVYTGSTDDVMRRFRTHAAGKGAKYTKSHPPVGIEASWMTESKEDALKLEYRIKRLKKEEKERILSNGLPKDFLNAFHVLQETECHTPDDK